MTGSNRPPSSHTASVRAPYAAPRESPAAPLGAGAARPTATRTLAPYAPVDLRDQHGGGSTGAPFIAQNAQAYPVGWPAGEADDQPSAELPWIDAFADDPSDATSSVPQAFVLNDAEGALNEMPGDVPPEVLATPTADLHAEEDVWPMDEAGAQLSEIAQDISYDGTGDVSRARSIGGEADASEIAESSSQPGPPQVLPMWNEDDWMDIMPSPAMSAEQQNTQPVEPIPAASDWAGQARHEQVIQEQLRQEQARSQDTRQQQADATALALESLAQRVRSGDLPATAFQPELGDAALLAAALAALLGSRP